MKNWLQALQRGAQYRVTRGGFLFILAVTLIGAAVASANNLLFLVVATMLSELLVSGLVSRLGLAGLEPCPVRRASELRLTLCQTIQIAPNGPRARVLRPESAQ